MIQLLISVFFLVAISRLQLKQGLRMLLVAFLLFMLLLYMLIAEIYGLNWSICLMIWIFLGLWLVILMIPWALMSRVGEVFRVLCPGSLSCNDFP